MLATILFRTVFRLTNFLSLASAACNSLRSSYRENRQNSQTLKQVIYLNLAPLEEFGILTWLSHYQFSSQGPKSNEMRGYHI